MKYTFEEFNEIFGLVFGFSFISIGLAISNFPFLYSCLLSFWQFITVVGLVIYSMCKTKIADENENECKLSSV